MDQAGEVKDEEHFPLVADYVAAPSVCSHRSICITVCCGAALSAGARTRDFAEFNDLVAIPNIASDAALSIPDVLQIPMAVAIFTHLGYPTYLLPFIGIAKILGVVAVLVPGFPRLKEWAYAGLVFDLTGALYSHISVGDSPANLAFPVIGLLLVIGSYLLIEGN
jgi:DoxX-like family